ncbi:transposase family protein [Cardinium endosymbiont of Philonthus spinipes]|uniref:transposase family protein n=1 Tax=Cardinium endosymbiont of Philonthus spinipes TaxID=3077941 RepID=UPI00313F09D8
MSCLTGWAVIEFSEVVKRLAPAWEKIVEQKKCHGRKSHVATLQDRVLCVLIYYRTYLIHIFWGYLFNLHNSNICRLLKKWNLYWQKVIKIKKDRSMTSDKILGLLVGATEQPTQRLQESLKCKKSYFSKKQMTTMKIEIVMESSEHFLTHAFHPIRRGSSAGKQCSRRCSAYYFKYKISFYKLSLV